MSFVLEDSNFFQLLGYIFSAFKRHDTNHAILKYSPFSKKLTYISMPLKLILEISRSSTENSRP